MLCAVFCCCHLACTTSLSITTENTQIMKSDMGLVTGVCVMHGMKTCVNGKNTFTTWGSRVLDCPKWVDVWGTCSVVLMVRVVVVMDIIDHVMTVRMCCCFLYILCVCVLVYVHVSMYVCICSSHPFEKLNSHGFVGPGGEHVKLGC